MAAELAIGNQTISLRAECGVDGDRPSLIAIELERSQEIYVFDRLDMPLGKQAKRGFRECLDAHQSGQHGRTFNLVVMQEGLSGRLERGLDGKTVMHSH